MEGIVILSLWIAERHCVYPTFSAQNTPSQFILHANLSEVFITTCKTNPKCKGVYRTAENNTMFNPNSLKKEMYINLFSWSQLNTCINKTKLPNAMLPNKTSRRLSHFADYWILHTCGPLIKIARHSDWDSWYHPSFVLRFLSWPGLLVFVFVLHILCCVYILFFFVLCCTLCCNLSGLSISDCLLGFL